MSLRANGVALTQGIKDLQAAWYQTRGSWRDAKAEEFAERYLADLPDMATKVGLMINELDNVLRKVKSDCE